MMDKRQFDELMRFLKSIEEKLGTLLSIQKAIMPKPSIGKEERKVLKLCDKKHTAEEIAKETGKTDNNVNVILSRLRSKGLAKSVDVKGRTVYEKI